MIPIISVVGKSGSGKTRFLTKLVPELVKRGYKIAVIKHDVHSRIDLPNKDTWQISKAGAKPVLIAGPKKMAVFQDLDKEKNLDELADYCGDADLIISEGYKKENKPKIEVYARGSLLCTENELVAVVSRKKISCPAPQFRLEEAKKIAGLIEKKYLRGKKTKKDVKLIINGQRIPLNLFVKDIFSSAILGMMKALKRLPKKPEKIELSIYA